MLVPYTSGLVAAISPCLIVMVPLLLFRFTLVDRTSLDNLPIYIDSDEEDAVAKKASKRARRSRTCAILWFVLGFQCSFLLFGFALTQLMNSSVQNGFKLGMGTQTIFGSVVCCSSGATLPRATARERVHV